MTVETIQIGENQGVTLTCYLQSARLFGKKVPAVVVCPGGGYIYHNEDEGESVAMAFYAQGFSAFVLHYSVGLQALWPQTVAEAGMAIRCIRAHAAEWDIAEDAIAIGGFSAGGHMAAAAATMWDLPEVRALAGTAACEGRPNAAFLIYPAVCMELPTVREGKLALVQTDCAACVGADTPPVFIAHSYGDTVAPLEQSLRFAQAMYDHDRPIECHFFTFGQHSALVRRSSGLDRRGIRIPNLNDWLPRCVEWLWDIFGHCRLDMQPDLAPEDAESWRRPHSRSLGSLLESDGTLFRQIFGKPQPKAPGISSRTMLGELLDVPEKRKILEEYFPLLKQVELGEMGRRMQLARLMALAGYREDDMSFTVPQVDGEMAKMLDSLNQIS